MIATPKPRKRRFRRAHQQQFVRMMPTITRAARVAFRDRDPEAREEAAAEVMAVAFVMYVGLVQDGREALAYPTVLAMYAIRRVKIGRKAAGNLNANEVLSSYAQHKRDFKVERLHVHDRQNGEWKEMLVEDRRAGPAEIAASRIDFAEWLRRLTARDRRIASVLAMGNSTSQAARRFRVSAGRISQKRRELQSSWEAFQGEDPHVGHDGEAAA